MAEDLHLFRHNDALKGIATMGRNWLREERDRMREIMRAM